MKGICGLLFVLLLAALPCVACKAEKQSPHNKCKFNFDFDRGILELPFGMAEAEFLGKFAGSFRPVTEQDLAFGKVPPHPEFKMYHNKSAFVMFSKEKSLAQVSLVSAKEICIARKAAESVRVESVRMAMKKRGFSALDPRKLEDEPTIRYMYYKAGLRFTFLFKHNKVLVGLSLVATK